MSVSSPLGTRGGSAYLPTHLNDGHAYSAREASQGQQQRRIQSQGQDQNLEQDRGQNLSSAPTHSQGRSQGQVAHRQRSEYDYGSYSHRAGAYADDDYDSGYDFHDQVLDDAQAHGHSHSRAPIQTQSSSSDSRSRSPRRQPHQSHRQQQQQQQAGQQSGHGHSFSQSQIIQGQGYRAPKTYKGRLQYGPSQSPSRAAMDGVELRYNAQQSFLTLAEPGTPDSPFLAQSSSSEGHGQSPMDEQPHAHAGSRSGGGGGGDDDDDASMRSDLRYYHHQQHDRSSAQPSSSLTRNADSTARPQQPQSSVRLKRIMDTHQSADEDDDQDLSSDPEGEDSEGGSVSFFASSSGRIAHHTPQKQKNTRGSRLGQQITAARGGPAASSPPSAMARNPSSSSAATFPTASSIPAAGLLLFEQDATTDGPSSPIRSADYRTPTTSTGPGPSGSSLAALASRWTTGPSPTTEQAPPLTSPTSVPEQSQLGAAFGFDPHRPQSGSSDALRGSAVTSPISIAAPANASASSLSKPRRLSRLQYNPPEGPSPPTAMSGAARKVQEEERGRGSRLAQRSLSSLYSAFRDGSGSGNTHGETPARKWTRAYRSPSTSQQQQQQQQQQVGTTGAPRLDYPGIVDVAGIGRSASAQGQYDRRTEVDSPTASSRDSQSNSGPHQPRELLLPAISTGMSLGSKGLETNGATATAPLSVTKNNTSSLQSARGELHAAASATSKSSAGNGSVPASATRAFFAAQNPNKNQDAGAPAGTTAPLSIRRKGGDIVPGQGLPTPTPLTFSKRPGELTDQEIVALGATEGQDPKSLLPADGAALSSKNVLTIALAKAQSAVTYDSSNSVPQAIEAYSQAVRLLQEVMERISPRQGSKKKSSRDEERRRLKVIHDTYTDRIRLLSMIYGPDENGEAENGEQEAGSAAQREETSQRRRRSDEAVRDTASEGQPAGSNGTETAGVSRGKREGAGVRGSGEGQNLVAKDLEAESIGQAQAPPEISIQQHPATPQSQGAESEEVLADAATSSRNSLHHRSDSEGSFRSAGSLAQMRHLSSSPVEQLRVRPATTEKRPKELWIGGGGGSRSLRRNGSDEEMHDLRTPATPYFDASESSMGGGSSALNNRENDRHWPPTGSSVGRPGSAFAGLRSRTSSTTSEQIAESVKTARSSIVALAKREDTRRPSTADVEKSPPVHAPSPKSPSLSSLRDSAALAFAAGQLDEEKTTSVSEAAPSGPPAALKSSSTTGEGVLSLAEDSPTLARMNNAAASAHASRPRAATLAGPSSAKAARDASRKFLVNPTVSSGTISQRRTKNLSTSNGSDGASLAATSGEAGEGAGPGGVLQRLLGRSDRPTEDSAATSGSAAMDRNGSESGSGRKRAISQPGAKRPAIASSLAPFDLGNEVRADAEAPTAAASGAGAAAAASAASSAASSTSAAPAAKAAPKPRLNRKISLPGIAIAQPAEAQPLVPGLPSSVPSVAPTSATSERPMSPGGGAAPVPGSATTQRRFRFPSPAPSFSSGYHALLDPTNSPSTLSTDYPWGAPKAGTGPSAPAGGAPAPFVPSASTDMGDLFPSGLASSHLFGTASFQMGRVDACLPLKAVAPPMLQPDVYEPMPMPSSNPALRPFNQARAMHTSVTTGGYISRKLCVPPPLWHPPVGVRLTALDIKARLLNLVVGAIDLVEEKGRHLLSPASSGGQPGLAAVQAAAFAKQLEDMDVVMSDVQSTLSKKLGSSVVEPSATGGIIASINTGPPGVTAPVVITGVGSGSSVVSKKGGSAFGAFGSKLLGRSLDRRGGGSSSGHGHHGRDGSQSFSTGGPGSNADDPTASPAGLYLDTLTRLLARADILDAHLASLLRSNRFRVNAAGLASLTDKDADRVEAYAAIPGEVRRVIEAKLRRSSDFFVHVVFKIVVRDMGVLLDKNIKRAGASFIE